MVGVWHFSIQFLGKHYIGIFLKSGLEYYLRACVETLSMARCVLAQ
jgi:hypothetical protein